jgi:ubiquinone/menaquinone biosynthesis C-methylase UbiE
MLTAVNMRAKELGLKNVECVQAGFLSYQHSGPQADFVYSRHALHQLPDFWKAIALRRIADVLRPGGVFRLRDLFLSCALNEVDEVVEAWLANAPANSSAGWPRSELETHLREEHSTFTWLFEPMLTQAGFTISAAAYTPSRTHASYTCVLADTSLR